MDELIDIPIEDINILCMAPLFIYEIMTDEAVNKQFLSGFHLIRAVEYGLVGNDTYSDALIDHMKSNLDNYHGELLRCSKTFTTDMTLTCLTRIPEITQQYKHLDLESYTFAMLSYAKHIASGIPFRNIPQHIDLDKFNNCLVKLTNILVR